MPHILTLCNASSKAFFVDLDKVSLSVTSLLGLRWMSHENGWTAHGSGLMEHDN